MPPKSWVWDWEWNWPRPLIPRPTVYIVSFVVSVREEGVEETQGFYVLLMFSTQVLNITIQFDSQDLGCMPYDKKFEAGGLTFLSPFSVTSSLHSRLLLPHPLLPCLHPLILPLYPFCLPPHPFTFSYPSSPHLSHLFILLPHPVCFSPHPFTFSSIPYLRPSPSLLPSHVFHPFIHPLYIPPSLLFTCLCAIFFSFDTCWV